MVLRCLHDAAGCFLSASNKINTKGLSAQETVGSADSAVKQCTFQVLKVLKVLQGGRGPE